jgi:hypothetical protein
VAPAVTAALGVCAVTTTSRISATVTLTVFEVAIVETVPTLYVTSAVLLMVVPAATPTACAGLTMSPSASAAATLRDMFRGDDTFKTPLYS